MIPLWTRAATTVIAAALALSPLYSTPARLPAPQALSSGVSTPLASTGGGASEITWSVRPGDADSPDGRSWVEWEADPGDRRAEHLVVSNHGDTAMEFRLTAADGYFTDTGRFNMLPSDQESTDAGTWISLPDTVSVPARGSTIVPFTITIPDDAAPGDHPAGVAASIVSPGAGTVGVESRVGFRVMTRVAGELEAELLPSIDGSYTGSINPFESGSLDVAYEVTNTGNTRVASEPRVSVSGPFGIVATQQNGEEIADIAPGESRTGTVRLASTWPLLWYDVRIDTEPAPVAESLRVETTQAANASTVVRALPWSQLAAVVIAAGLLCWYLLQRRRNKARTELLVAAAREEGREEGPRS